jgi:hypothetical protein
VLLLLKEKLRRESPPDSNEALIYEKVEFQRKGGKVVVVGTGKKTVDVIQIIERFRSLGLSLDEHRLRQLQGIRNDIEHQASKYGAAKVQEAVARTFVLVASALEEHLDLKPHDVFDGNVWQAMLSETETFKAIEDRCRTSVDDLAGVPDAATDALECIECTECGSALMEAAGKDYFDAKFTCRSCGADAELSAVIQKALASIYAGDAYAAMKDGTEPTIGTCPTCGAQAFRIEDDVCLVCGESRSYTECLRCEAPLGLDEQDTGLCSYCEHMTTKDD